MNQKNLLPILLVILTAFSCKKYRNPNFETILKSSENHFRGIEIGSTIENVKAIEDSSYLIDNMRSVNCFKFVKLIF